MNNWLEQLRLIFFTILVLVYMFDVFIDSLLVEYILGIIVIGCLFISFQGANRLFQVISILFLTISTILYQQFTDLSWLLLPTYLTSTVLLLALLYVLIFIHNLIIVGRYDQDINRLLHIQTQHLGQLYHRVSLVSYVLSLFIFFVTIPLVHNVLKKNIRYIPNSIQEKFISQSILRAFAMANSWSPIEIIIVLVIAMTSVHYLSLLPWLFLFSMIMLAIEWLNGRKYKSYIVNATPAVVNNKTQAIKRHIIKKIGTLIFALVLLIVTVFFVHHILNVDFFTAMILVLIPYSVLWSFMINRFHAYLQYSLIAWQKRTPELHHLMLLFLSLGFFNSMMKESNLLHAIQDPFLLLAEMPLLLFICIQLVSILLPILGIHSIVTLGILGVLIQPLLTLINPLSLAIVLITANLAPDASGTYKTSVTIMSRQLKISPYKITWWNIGFSFVYSSVGVLMAWMLL